MKNAPPCGLKLESLKGSHREFTRRGSFGNDIPHEICRLDSVVIK